MQLTQPQNNASSSQPAQSTESEESRTTVEQSTPHQEASTLLSAIWKSGTGVHQLAHRKPSARQWPHIAVTDISAAATKALALSEAGEEVYFACAEYKTAQNRKADNTAQAWAFWLDIDCGPEKAEADKGYADIAEAETALLGFCQQTGLPTPTHLVNSGGGLHVYWVLSAEVPTAVWVTQARQLKELTQKLSFKADPSRTADIASVLRVPGTLNHKYAPPQPVQLVYAGASLDRDAFLRSIEDAHSRFCTIQEVVVPAAPSSQVEAAEQSFGPPDLTKLKSALATLDPDCEESTWKLRRLAPMAVAAREHPALAEQIKAIAKAWSSGELRGKPSKAWSTPGTSNQRTGADVFDEVWDRFATTCYSGRQVTLGTVYRDAEQAGWSHEAECFDVVETQIIDAPLNGVVQIEDGIAMLMAKVEAGDNGAPLESNSVELLTSLQDNNPAEYQRVRMRLKQLNKHVSLGAIDSAITAQQRRGRSTAPTHHGYANSILESLTFENWRPVGHEGSLYVVDPQAKLWMRKEASDIERAVAEMHDDNDNCSRRADYSAIAQHAVSLVSNQDFFAEAEVGLACPGGFYSIVGGVTNLVPLTPAHRQRVGLDITPIPGPTPLFDDFLAQTFKAQDDNEKQQQIALIQEIAGAVMLGLMPLYQKAILFYDPYGRAGKGTLESILRLLVPKVFITAVSPFAWKEPYFIAALAGARLNVVGELPDNESIPAAIFKSVLGGDLLTGRNPCHRPITFKNEAAHIFMSNHMISTRDQSEAFFARWLIVEFPNSRLRSGLPIDPHIAQRIIEQEMAGIAAWALEGAARLLRNGRFSPSVAHERLMQKWRRSSNSLEECIHEDFDLSDGYSIRRSHFYEHYKEWCEDNGRKPFAKARVKELLEFNMGLGVKLAKLDGYEIFRGLRLKPNRIDDPSV